MKKAAYNIVPATEDILKTSSEEGSRKKNKEFRFPKQIERYLAIHLFKAFRMDVSVWFLFLSIFHVLGLLFTQSVLVKVYHFVNILSILVHRHRYVVNL